MDFPEHLKYFSKLRAAQQKANESGKRAQICWRGHRTSVCPKPGNAKLAKKDMLCRLVNALKSVRKMEQKEKEVIIYCN